MIYRGPFISIPTKTYKTYYYVVMVDFYAKVGVQNCSESVIGCHGFGSRNQRGQMLVKFLERKAVLDESFFRKIHQEQPQGKWTWRSPETVTKNEIAFIMKDRKQIFRDVSVINE